MPAARCSRSYTSSLINGFTMPSGTHETELNSASKQQYPTCSYALKESALVGGASEDDRRLHRLGAILTIATLVGVKALASAVYKADNRATATALNDRHIGERRRRAAVPRSGVVTLNT